MAQLLATGREAIPVADDAGDAIIHDFTWEVTKAANGDTVLLGYLPAFHKITPENSSLITAAGTPAMNVDICVGQDADAIVAGAALTAGFSRAAITTHQKCFELGKAGYNRPIYAKLNTAPTAAGGQLVLRLGYVAD